MTNITKKEEEDIAETVMAELMESVNFQFHAMQLHTQMLVFATSGD